jgi:hypothetical protein
MAKQIRYSDSRGNWFCIEPSNQKILNQRIQDLSADNGRSVYVWNNGVLKAEYKYGRSI